MTMSQTLELPPLEQPAPETPPAAPADEALRIRQATQPDTPAAVLRGLASDPSVTVRAAVAMNTAAPAQVDDILARDADERVRALLAHRLAILLPHLPGSEANAMQQHVLATLASLVLDEAVRVRAAIADAVRDMPQAPRDLVLTLARDAAVPVSDPVIRLSPLLTADDLLALIADPPSPATAVSIARRPGLNAEVSDSIAATANAAAITALLGNKSAAIREATLDHLISRAAEHADWHEPLVHRPVLPARAARVLTGIVATHLLGSLARRPDLDRAVLREIETRLTRGMALGPASPLAAPDMGDEQAREAAAALASQGALDEDTVLGAIQRGEARFAAALLARAAEVPVSVVDRASSLRSAKGIVSLAWRAGFSMRVAVPLQGLLARLPPASVLPAAPGDTYPLAVEEMRWQVDFLTRMER